MVLDSRYDVIMAKPTASDSGTNSERTGSAMMNAGMNTDRMHTIASRRGTAVSLLPRSHRPGQRRSVLHLRVDVLERDGRLVDEDADGQGQAAEGHDVDGVARHPQSQQRTEQRHGDVEDHDDHAAPVAQEQQDHQPGQRGADGAFRGDAADRFHHGRRFVEFVADVHALRAARS